MDLQAFVKKLADDKELVEKIGKAANPDEAYQIAKEAGLDVSFEEFSEAMTKFSKANAEMSPEEVDAVVGGASTTEIVSAVSSTVSAAASAGAAAAV